MSQTIDWYQAHLPEYTVLAFAVLAAALAAGFTPLFEKRLPWRLPAFASRALFFALIAAALFVFRWPMLTMDDAIQGDESALVVIAQSASHDPVPWESYDPATSGPLNALALVPVVTLAREHLYFGVRAFACALIVLALFFVYECAGSLYGELVGRLTILPAVVFFSVVTSYDLTPYTSEILANMLIAAAGFVVVRMSLERVSPIASFCGGALVGAIPLAKLQTAPIAFALAVLLVAVAWRAKGRRTAAIAAITGFLTPLAVLAAILASRGVLTNALISSVLQSRTYVSGSPKQLFLDWWYVLFFSQGTGAFFGGSCVALALLRGMVRPFGPAAQADARRAVVMKWAPYAAGLVTLAAIVSIAIPGYWSQHYLLLAVLPLTATTGFSLGKVLESRPDDASNSMPRWALGAIAIFAGCSILPPIVDRLAHLAPSSWALSHPFLHRNDDVVRVVRFVARPGDAMSVWGFMPDLYIVANAADATEDAHTPSQIRPGPYREYFRARYLRELQAGRPALFVDAVGPGTFMFQDPASEGVAGFPALAEYVHEGYCLVDAVGGDRIYIRRDLRSQRWPAGCTQ